MIPLPEGHDITKPPEKLNIEAAQPVGGAAGPTVVQIGWELVETLNRAGLLDAP